MNRRPPLPPPPQQRQLQQMNMNRCELCGRVFGDYEKLQIHVFTECDPSGQKQAKLHAPEVVRDDHAVGLVQSSSVKSNNNNKYHTLPTPVLRTMLGSNRQTPSNAPTPVASDVRVVDDSDGGVFVLDLDARSNDGESDCMSETLDDADEKTVDVDEAEALVEARQCEVNDDENVHEDMVRFFYSRIWESTTSDATYGGSSMGVTICFEAALYLLHGQPMCANGVDEIIRTGCLVHPHPGPLPFGEVYKLRRYTQLDIKSHHKYNTRDHSGLIDALPSFIAMSRVKPLCVLITGASAGSVLIYFDRGNLYIFDPQVRTNEETGDKSSGAAILQFATLAFLESYLLMLLSYVRIEEDDRQDTLFNSYDLVTLSLKNGAPAFERLVTSEPSPVAKRKSRPPNNGELVVPELQSVVGGELSPVNSANSIEIAAVEPQMPQQLNVENLLDYVRRLRAHHDREIVKLNEALERERHEKMELVNAIEAESRRNP